MMTIVPYNGFDQYIEIAQINSIKWKICEQTEENSKCFIEKTNWFKCRDFFNDWSVSRQTPLSFTKYGFPTHIFAKTPKAPGWLLVSNHSASFISNLKVLNDWLLKEQYHSTIKVYQTTPNEQLLLKIPPFYLRNSYNISLLTLLFRCLSVNITYKSFKEFTTTKKLQNDQDKLLLNVAIEKNYWFKFHRLLHEYSWYYDKEINSKQYEKHVYPMLVHDCGFVKWSSCLPRIK